MTIGQLTMQQLHILHCAFRFYNCIGYIVINCTSKYALIYGTYFITRLTNGEHYYNYVNYFVYLLYTQLHDKLGVYTPTYSYDGLCLKLCIRHTNDYAMSIILYRRQYR